MNSQTGAVMRDETKFELPIVPSIQPSSWCALKGIEIKLRDAGLRLTRQRMELAQLLFGKGDRHLTAEALWVEAGQAQMQVSLATVYNTLHHFTEQGLLRRIAVDATRTFFDTNNTAHSHFLFEDDNALLDIVADAPLVGKLPAVPEGYELDRVDVVVRLRRKQEARAAAE
jgi:Fur family transcriptional regulator, iron response regulator